MKNLLFKTDLSSPTADWGLLILRVGVGLMMAFGHGLGKFNMLLSGAEFGDPIGLGAGLSLFLTVFAEFFCSLGLVVGLLTRAASIPLIVTMLVAALVVHADDPFGNKEKALLFLTAYIPILLAGAGRFSLDNLIGRKLGVNAK